MAASRKKVLLGGVLGGALLAVAGCDTPLDFDLRNLGGGLSTSAAARSATADRPQADARGVISYPHYQVAIAQRGDRIADVATRVGIPVEELARYNGISTDVTLRENEVIALPRRVSEPTPGADDIDITTLAGDAIDRAGSGTNPPQTSPGQQGPEPIRHRVEPGESAYSISRLYNVSVRALAQWNGLGPDLAVRSGQYLLIPVVIESETPGTTPKPGEGSPTPEPPSAATPLPSETPRANPTPPASPDLGNDRTAASDSASMAMPVTGKIIRPYDKGRNDGIDIAADARTPVLAADDGVVAAITRDTDSVPIVVLKHSGNLLTVYAGVDALKVKKGDRVKRGQQIAQLRAGSPSFLHFEVRKGLESTDPMEFLTP